MIDLTDWLKDGIKSYIIIPLLGKRVIHFVKTLLGKNKEKTTSLFFEEGKSIKDLSEVLGIKNIALLYFVNTNTCVMYFYRY